MLNTGKSFSLFLAVLISLYSSSGGPVSAMEAAAEAGEAYRNPGIKEKNKFQREKSPCYLKCILATDFPKEGFSDLKFEIIAKKGTLHEGQNVGHIGVRYCQKASPKCSKARIIEIGWLGVEEKYRRQGYGEGALRTVLGIFRAPTKERLLFDEFCLNVTLRPDGNPARALYSKVGFKVKKVYPPVHYQEMTLPRTIASAMEAAAEAGETYRNPGIKAENKFQREKNPCYLKCREATDFPEEGFGNFSFDIIVKEGPHAQQKVGCIDVRYSQKASPMCSKARIIEIGWLEIEEKYRRQGYGEGALSTVLGIFRASTRKHLLFDRFSLSVGLDSNRDAARELYSKVGFKVERMNEEIGYQDMTLPRAQ